MAELHVRNLPPELHARLQQRAAAEGRSMSAETVAILRSALSGAQPTSGRRDAIGRLRAIQARATVGPGLPTAEELAREDRERAR